LVDLIILCVSEYNSGIGLHGGIGKLGMMLLILTG
jgi:hypothetical protein